MNAARDRAQEATFQQMGTVVGAPDEGALIVETPSGRFEARVAASCLLEPALEDDVLVAVPARGSLYVLAVLERHGEDPLRLRLRGSDASIDVPDGALRMSAKEGVKMVTPGDVEIVAGALHAMAKEGRLHFGRLMTEGREVVARAEVVKTVVDTLDATAERVTQRMKRSVRIVEESDVTRAGHIDTRAKESLVLRAKDALINARRLFRLDGEQIHLG